MVHSLQSLTWPSFCVPSNSDDSVVWCTLEGWKVGFSGSNSRLLFLEEAHLYNPYWAKNCVSEKGVLGVFFLRERVLVLILVM